MTIRIKKYTLKVALFKRKARKYPSGHLYEEEVILNAVKDLLGGKLDSSLRSE